jgi:hypothetical protein
MRSHGHDGYVHLKILLSGWVTLTSVPPDIKTLTKVELDHLLAVKLVALVDNGVRVSLLLELAENDQREKVHS